MKYLFLMYDVEDQPEGDSDEELQKWFKITEDMEKAGVMLGGEALKPSSTATTLRGKDESYSIIDGPFAETKEQLGGYYIVDVKDLDEATQWASKLPHMERGGSVEIRPIMSFE